jgi:hypothetical protein
MTKENIRIKFYHVPHDNTEKCPKSCHSFSGVTESYAIFYSTHAIHMRYFHIA